MYLLLIRTLIIRGKRVYVQLISAVKKSSKIQILSIQHRFSKTYEFY